jgi:hypothetical protein
MARVDLDLGYKGRVLLGKTGKFGKTDETKTKKIGKLGKTGSSFVWCGFCAFRGPLAELDATV